MHRAQVNRPSPINWGRVAVLTMFGALFIFNDSGPLPLAKPRTTEAPVASRDLDTLALERHAAALRTIWERDQQAYANYLSGAAAARRQRDAQTFAIGAAEWDSSLRVIQSDLQRLKVPRTSNGELKGLLDGSAMEFAAAVASERRIAQSVLVMLSNGLDISREIASEMKQANMASVRSHLALRSAYQLLGMDPQPTPQRWRDGGG